MRRTVDHIHDEWLVIRAQGGDADGFRELMERWHPRLFGFVARLIDGHNDAADLEQDVWATVARKIRRLNDPACFPQWVFRIASTRCADWIRHRQRDRHTLDQVAVEQNAITEPQPEDTTGTDDIARLRRAISQLPSDQRLVLTMFYIDDLSVRTISESLGIPEGTVKSRLHTARTYLREILERRRS